jgi:hypothetical protein
MADGQFAALAAVMVDQFVAQDDVAGGTCVPDVLPVVAHVEFEPREVKFACFNRLAFTQFFPAGLQP